jgi:DNA polymerase III delta prime subunit
VKPGTGKGDESDKLDDNDGPGPGPSADAPVQNGRLSSGTGQDMNFDGRSSSTNSPEAETTSTGQPDIATNSCVSGPTIEPPAAETNPAKPKKLLLLNPKTGTIGSPPKPKASKVAAEEPGNTGKKPPGRRGRKPASKIVRITYGTDPKTRVRLGEMINTILSGDTQHAVASSKQSPTSSAKKQSPRAPRTIAPTMTTHPFFVGQPKKSEAASVDAEPEKPTTSPLTARTKHYHVTPCSPRKPRAGPALPKPPMLRFGVKNLGLKFPGAQLPAWPWQGITHVRGGDIESLNLENEPLPLVSRKSKGNAVKVSPGESVVSLVIDSVGLAAMAKAVRNINTDNAVPPPPELRLPQKHFESGSKLQARILSELKTFQRSLPGKLASCNGSIQGGEGSMQAPPQLARFFDSISSSLSAFDMSQCETANWVQKYAPTSAVEVLQPGREAFFLKEWLQALMVQSVDTGSADTDKPKVASKAKAAGAGKKKRRKKLDGFIVSSEDENYEVYELSDDGDDWAPSGSRGIIRKTVVRSGNLAKDKDGVKTANTLVISGPPGCGKTAAVYAVAKELDFEVFEINASTRRSGKDVLEKIGDMTRNHHVQQHQSTGTPGEDDQGAAIEDDTAKDIKSGKQPTMNAFFKAKGTTAKPKQPSKSAKPTAKSLSSEVKKEPSKNQRQSLILLEEVDVLYDEDKQFWTTIVGLIAQAKRPFIMTCNDETLVPLHTLPLHGIFRLSTPPRDLSVDRLILIAANEGHALTRQSVEQLYDSRDRDLRAATMDLQYWCQIGVGDRRGGFDWFLNRWPRGVDLDENKEVVRVVSEDTYQPGMNLLGRDSIVDNKASPRLVEEEVLHQAWESWGLDMGHWQDTVGLTSWAEGLEPVTTMREARLGALEAYDSLADAMSAADVCSHKAFAAFKEVSLFPCNDAFKANCSGHRRPSTRRSQSWQPRPGMTLCSASRISKRPLSHTMTP